MDHRSIKQEILKTVNEELDIWLAKEPTIKDGYTYEDEVLKMTLRIGRQILSKSQGDITPNKNKKKASDEPGTT